MMIPVRLLQEHGYLAASLAVLAEFSGLPVPAGLVIFLLGALAPTLGISPVKLTLAATPAALLPDTGWFLAGRRGGIGLIRLYCKVTLGSKACTERTSRFFARSGASSLLLAKFVPGLATFAAPMAGGSGLSLTRFWLWDGAGTALWATAWLGAGRFVGPGPVTGWVEDIHGAGAELSWAAGAVLAAYLAMKIAMRARYGPAVEESLS